MKRMRRLACLALLVAAPLVASAQPKTADDWYKEGETQYNLGNFDAAAEAFKQGFAAETIDNKKAAYLYNVAQAYRQGNKCKDAAFFYKRYLALRDQETDRPLRAEKRAEIQQRIKELEDCAATQDHIAHQPPDNTIRPTGDGSGSGSGAGATAGSDAQAGKGSGSGGQVATGSDGDDDDDGDGDEDLDQGIHAGTTAGPKLLSARFTVGAAKLNAGGLDVPFEPTMTLAAGYPLHVIDQVGLDVGLAASFTSVPYINTITTEKQRASFSMLLANASATYPIIPKLSAHGDLGLGAMFLGGIDQMGSPFTDAGAATTGALTMFALRFAVSADYEIAPNLSATVTPFAFSYSPAKTGLREDIKAFTRIDFMAGIGYRM